MSVPPEQLERLRVAVLQSKALLDQLEAYARSLQPQFERLAEFGPDGSPEDTWVARTACNLLCSLLDARHVQDQVEVFVAQAEAPTHQIEGSDDHAS